MTRNPKIRKGKPFQLPILGKGQHNAGIQILIGGLVIAWANNESVFLAILQCLVTGDKHTAAIIWHSHRTTVGRLDLVFKLAREQIKNETLIADLGKLIERFKSLSRARNFYCHATYQYGSELEIHSALGVTLTQEGSDVASFEEKKFDRGTANEIRQATLDLAEFNRETWNLVSRIEAELKVQRVIRPRLLDELMAQENHPPTDEPQEP